ncbi:MAG: phage baseplate assembly protein [Erythrobacter sp.]
MPQITLISNGRTWTGFQTVSILKSMDDVVHALTLQTTDRANEGIERWNVQGGSAIQVEIDGVLSFDGYVTRYSPNIGAESHSISIDASSRAIDIVECSHDGRVFWKNVSAESIIREVIAPFGLALDIQSPMKAIGKTGFRVGVDESPFSIIRTLAEKNGLSVYSLVDGTIVLSRTPSEEIVSTIGRGQYVSMSTNHDLSQSFSEVIVKSQQNTTEKDFAGQQRVERRFDNTAQTRHRPLVVIKNGTDEEQRDFAQMAQRRFSGNVLGATVTVKSAFRNPTNGPRMMWDINAIVFVDEPAADVSQNLLIKEVEFSVSEGQGFQTNLILGLAESYDYLTPDRPQTITPAIIGQGMEQRRAIGPFADLMGSLRQAFG